MAARRRRGLGWWWLPLTAVVAGLAAWVAVSVLPSDSSFGSYGVAEGGLASFSGLGQNPALDGELEKSMRLRHYAVHEEQWPSFSSTSSSSSSSSPIGADAEQRWVEKTLFGRQYPVLVRSQKRSSFLHSLAEAWAAILSARPALRELINLDGVRVQDAPTFTVRAERSGEEGHMLGANDPQTLAYVSLSLEMFMRRQKQQQQSSSPDWLYWTGALEELHEQVRGTGLWSPAQMEAANAWRRLRALDQGALHFNYTLDDAAAMLWMGHAGVTAQMHYDKSHNMYVQLAGRKRWLLFPPSEHDHLYQFPHIHVANRQSQAQMDTYDAQAFPQMRAARGMEVILEPGDLLYVPPYWSHRVTAMDTALSLSVLSPSETEIVFSSLYWVSIPFAGISERAEKVVGAQIFLMLLFEAIPGVASPLEQVDGSGAGEVGHDAATRIARFAEQLYHVRFSHLFDENSLFMREHAAFDCYRSDPAVRQAALDKVSLKTMRAAASELATTANWRYIDPYARLIWMRDYTEFVARWAMGPDEAVLFIRHCFRAP